MKRLISIGIILSASCSSRLVTAPNATNAQGVTVYGKMFTTIYQQRAAEYRALCLQAYNIAHWQLDQYKPSGDKPKAIITDIDETVLDNSPYQAHQALLGNDYDHATWLEWTNKSAADTLAGSATFLKYAASKGIEIFYITNREEQERVSTLKNLEHFNLPNADNAHLFLKQNTPGKESRRQQVLNTHEVIMLLGDNLADFSSLFDKKAEAERMQNTNLSTKDFGSRFIVLPNPVYGDWESSLYKFSKLTRAQKDSVIRAEVRGF